ncbi:MAG: beta-galactosidase trimerization domain-containing protein [Candidatus Omnitrophota bacterium]
MKNLSAKNEWLWNSRWTHWWFKKIEAVAEILPDAGCMEPSFSGIVDDKEIARCVNDFKKHNINTILTEGLRRVILFEHEGKTGEVNEAIKKITKACHSKGIRVVHHTTAVLAGLAGGKLNTFSDDRRAWLNIDARTGTYAYLDQWGGWYLWCINNPDFRAEYFRLCRKIVRETKVDGLMVDEVYFRTGWHNCACPHCREKYLKKTGFILPPPEDSSFWGNLKNPAFRAWLRFRTVSVGDFYEDLYAGIKKEHAHPVLLGCKNWEPSPLCSQYFGENNEERMRGANLLFFENGSDSFLYNWRFFSSQYMTYGGLSNYYGTPTMAVLGAPYRPEGFISWALSVAHGVRVWALSRKGSLSCGEGLPFDPEDMKFYGGLFGWEEKHKGELTGVIQSLAGIGILLSAATRDMTGGGDWDNNFWDMDYAKELLGWCQTLADEYIQYAVMVEQQLTISHLKKYSLVILPNAACLSNSACTAISGYLFQGGNLIFTCETGLYDETGSRKTREEELGTILGVNQKTDDGNFPGSVQFGRYGSGQWVYFSNKPGLAGCSWTNQRGDPRTWYGPAIPDKDRKIQQSLMVQTAKWAAGEQIVTIKQAPPGLLIKAFHRKDSGGHAVVIHLLNLRGGTVKVGEVIPLDYPVEFPPLEDDIIIELQIDSINPAYLISPDWQGKKQVKVETKGKGFRVTVPAGTLKRYEVLCLFS